MSNCYLPIRLFEKTKYLLQITFRRRSTFLILHLEKMVNRKDVKNSIRYPLNQKDGIKLFLFITRILNNTISIYKITFLLCKVDLK